MHGIATDLSVMVHALTVQAKGFRLDRIELRSDHMRALEQDLALAVFGVAVKVAPEHEQPPRSNEERRFAGLPLIEVTRDNAPGVAIVMDMNYAGVGVSKADAGFTA